MKARIILSTADFSANNIGKITELGDLTKAVLTKQTQYSEDSTEAAALDTFLKALEENGFIGGESPLLKTLVIPALASGHDQFLYNIARLDGSGYPINIMPADEISAQTKAFTALMNSDKIVGVVVQVQSNSDPQGLLADPIFEGLTTNTKVPSWSIAMYTPEHLNTYPDRLLWSGNLIINSQEVTTRNGANSVTNATSGKFFGFTGLSYVQESTHEVVSDTLSLGAASESGTVTGITLKENRLMSLGNEVSSDYRKFKFALLAFGDYVNPTKMATLKGLTATLMSALHVNF